MTAPRSLTWFRDTASINFSSIVPEARVLTPGGVSPTLFEGETLTRTIVRWQMVAQNSDIAAVLGATTVVGLRWEPNASGLPPVSVFDPGDFDDYLWWGEVQWIPVSHPQVSYAIANDQPMSVIDTSAQRLAETGPADLQFVWQTQTTASIQLRMSWGQLVRGPRTPVTGAARPPVDRGQFPI